MSAPRTRPAPQVQQETPPRPADTWRVCGEDVTYGPGGGCVCGPNGPDRWQAKRARVRLGEAA